MLALATHEVHFSILREELVKQEMQQNCSSSLETNLQDVEPKVKSRRWYAIANAVNGSPTSGRKNYQFLNIWTLREYLEIDLTIPDPPFVTDFEKIVDDFIFICFFSGNDFLPHLPSIEIHEGGIDLLMAVYKEVFRSMGGYLTNVNRIKERKVAYIKLKRVERFILEVGSYEEQIFKKRSNLRQCLIRRMMRKKFEDMYQEGFDNFHEHEEPIRNDHSRRGYGESSNGENKVLENSKLLKHKLKEMIRQRSDLLRNNCSAKDKVNLGKPGWKCRYYREKFSSQDTIEIQSKRKEIVKNYAEGLCWVFHYYFAGVCSWKWYYKYHYGPFASDLRGLASSQIKFEIGDPFNPFLQLMGVLPARSAHALPKAYRSLMTSSESPIRDFYPNVFEVDTDGKRYSWQGVAKLAFINEKRLVLETQKLEKELKEDEVRRNIMKSEKIFVRACHSLGPHFDFQYCNHNPRKHRLRNKIDYKASDGINGFLLPCVEGSIGPNFQSPIKGMEDIMDIKVVCAVFNDPEFHQHIPRTLEGVEFPKKEITEDDIVKRPLWHEYEGNRPVGNQGSHNQLRFVKDDENGTSPGSTGRNWNLRGRVIVPLSSNRNADSFSRFSGEDQGFRDNGWRRRRGRSFAASSSGRNADSFGRTPVNNGGFRESGSGSANRFISSPSTVWREMTVSDEWRGQANS